MDALRRCTTLLIALGALACEAEPAARAPDAEPPTVDAEVPDELLLSAGTLRLTVSPDGTRLALRDPAGPLLTDIAASITLAGRALDPRAWPSRGWTVAEGRAVGRFPAADGLPDLTWTVGLSARGLDSALAVEGAGPVVPLEATRPLVATPTAWLGADGVARPPAGAGWAPLPVASRSDSQWLRGDRGVLGVRADGPVTVSLAAALTVSDRRPAAALGRGGRVQTATVTLALPEADPPPPATEGAPTGWRSAAWGSAVNRALVLRQAEALTLRGPPDALLLLDGLWYAGPGDARGGLPFPGGLAALVERIAPLALAAAWPLHAAPDAPVVLDHPAAALDETERCRRPACVRLDPRVPAVRADAARGLLAAPLDAVWLVDLPDAAVVGQAALAALAEEVADATGRPARAAAAPPWPLGDPCRAAAGAHPWPAGCAARLVEANQSDPQPPPALEGLAWRALDAAGYAFDPGPVRLDRDAGAARLAVALGWIAGGPRLVGDDLAALPEVRWPLALSFWRHAVGPARAVALDEAGPPTRWRSAEVHLWTQWADAPGAIVAPEGGPWRDLLRPEGPEWPAGAAITVPPRDAVALAPASWFTAARGKE